MNFQKLFLTSILAASFCTYSMQNKFCFSVDISKYNIEGQLQRLLGEIQYPYNNNREKLDIVLGRSEPGTVLVIVDDTPENIVNNYRTRIWFTPNTQIFSCDAILDGFSNNLQTQPHITVTIRQEELNRKRKFQS